MTVGVVFAVHDALHSMKGLINQGWCQGHMAVDQNGYGVDPNSEKACQWCLAGAKEKAEMSFFFVNNVHVQPRAGFLTELRDNLEHILREACLRKINDNKPKPEGNFLWVSTVFNDRIAETKDQVIAVIDEALAMTEKKRQELFGKIEEETEDAYAKYYKALEACDD